MSRAWHRPMQFVCQIPLQVPFFGALTSTMAYLFITHATYQERDMFFDPDIIFPDAGENALILQPGGQVLVETLPLRHGPSLYLEDGTPVEYSVELVAAEDPDFVPQHQYTVLGSAEQEAYFAAVSGNKLGGTPAFFQGDEWPEGGAWRLLLQLDRVSVPFYLNLGASPILFAFISGDGQQGRMLIQDT